MGESDQRKLCTHDRNAIITSVLRIFKASSKLRILIAYSQQNTERAVVFFLA